MAKGKGRPNSMPKAPGPSNNRRKGDVVENIAAALYVSRKEATVETRVFVPALDGGPPREIDVLVTPLQNPECRTALECKNEAKPIGIERIDAFIGKLLHVGIPAGVFVSASGFTSNALRRARTAGIRVLNLSGLASDRLGPELHLAIQSFVHHMLVVEELLIRSEAMPDSAADEDIIRFLDATAEIPEYPFSPLDLIFREWVYGNPPSYPGCYVLNLTPPASWEWSAKSCEMPSITATVRVVAYVGSFHGTAERLALVDPETKVRSKWSINSKFETFPSTVDVVPIYSGRDLRSHLAQQALVRIELPHVRCPRIRHVTYWPPSDRVHEFMTEKLQEAISNNDPYALSRIPFEEIEGTDLKEVWAPIWRGYPLSWLEKAS